MRRFETLRNFVLWCCIKEDYNVVLMTDENVTISFVKVMSYVFEFFIYLVRQRGARKQKIANTTSIVQLYNNQKEIP